MDAAERERIEAALEAERIHGMKLELLRAAYQDDPKTAVAKLGFTPDFEGAGKLLSLMIMQLADRNVRHNQLRDFFAVDEPTQPTMNDLYPPSVWDPEHGGN